MISNRNTGNPTGNGTNGNSSRSSPMRGGRAANSNADLENDLGTWRGNMNNEPNTVNNNNNNDAVNVFTAAATTGGDGLDWTRPVPPTPANLVAWRERERRQRTVRVLLMVLLMLLLMDGEEPMPVHNNYSQQQQQRLRRRRRKAREEDLIAGHRSQSHSLNTPTTPAASSTSQANAGNYTQRRHRRRLPPEVWTARRAQDQRLQALAVHHPRYKTLVDKNGGRDYAHEIQSWVEERLEEWVKRKRAQNRRPNNEHESEATPIPLSSLGDDFEDPKLPVLHYPWNATGYYRGSWTRETESASKTTTTASTDAEVEGSTGTVDDNSESTSKPSMPPQRFPAPQLEPLLLSVLHHKQFSATQLLSQSGSQSAITSSKEGAFSGQPSPSSSTILPIASIFHLPPGLSIEVRDDHNLTTLQWEEMTVDSAGIWYGPSHQAISSTSARMEEEAASTSPTPMATTAAEDTDDSEGDDATITNTNTNKPQTVKLSESHGRAAFQLYSRSIPAMQELSLVDGFVKLYDSAAPGYSTSRDLLLRVRGVLIHAVGHLSLTSNVDVTRHAFVMDRLGSEKTSNNNGVSSSISFDNLKSTDSTENIGGGTSQQQRAVHSKIKLSGKEDQLPLESARRRLQENLETLRKDSADHGQYDEIRRDAETLLRTSQQEKDSQWTLLFSSIGRGKPLDDESVSGGVSRRLLSSDAEVPNVAAVAKSRTRTESAVGGHGATTKTIANNSAPTETDIEPALPDWSPLVIPFPYVRDDEKESIRRTRTPVSRRMPYREQQLEANGRPCAFEILLEVSPSEEWTIQSWKSLLAHKWKEIQRLNPFIHPEDNENNSLPFDAEATLEQPASNDNRRNHHKVSEHSQRSGTTHVRNNYYEDQALVMSMDGWIESQNCGFRANVNATALRTDWELTTSMAINYSFYMMLVCLAQIILLLRQLLHSQAQSLATRVSMIGIGWQTVLDALICLGHVYLSLAIQPLFTAFASVAFFKLLIFCVIEMKYMAIIIQARNSANGGQPTEVLRRQVAVLHLRFYLALLATFVVLFYIGEGYRVAYMLTLYSFWIPQIIFNVITEAKNPLHKYYIYGMSLTRLVAPLYLYGIKQNFLAQVYPDAAYDPWMCQWLILWVGSQVLILLGQAKYGARFCIPACFLPPKYDYSRPIPPALLRAHVPGSGNGSHTNSSGTSSESLSSAPPVVMDDGSSSLVLATARHTTSVTTRNRGRRNGRHAKACTTEERGNRLAPNPSNSGNTHAANHSNGISNGSHNHTSNYNNIPSNSCSVMDCSICYETIQVTRQAYMLAPCDHLFHRDCLVQWMDIKMECPICRTDLPPI